ncbi:hypothetical protein PCANB_000823 [Pneumocystis canis]|nr:hypothetical protein PCK1_000847 [Pneumocystis canis]KAG5437392.1 hypothetical protein PCANB_000823 [Pneumocystis canis]
MSLDVSPAVKPWAEEKGLKILEIDEESLFQPLKTLFLKENIQNDGSFDKEVLQTLTSLCFPSTPSPRSFHTDSRDIVQLKQFIPLLQQRVQHLVHAQSRALFYREGSVNTIRMGILHTMLALMDVQNAIYRCLSKQSKFKTEGLEKLNQWKDEQQYLATYIREKEESDENKKLISSLHQQKNRLSLEINEIEIKLAEKKKDLKKILDYIEELKSSSSTGLSKERSRLAEITSDETKFIEQFKKLIPQSDQAKLRDTLHGIWEAELSAINDDIKLAQSEYSTLSEGSKLWCTTITFLQSLEQNVYEYMKKGNHNASEVVSIIDKGLLRLRDLIRIVSNRHLDLLYIAIGHEIEALNRTRRIILSADDKA